jgi:hypothetical protein
MKWIGFLGAAVVAFVYIGIAGWLSERYSPLWVLGGILLLAVVFLD